MQESTHKERIGDAAEGKPWGEYLKSGKEIGMDRHPFKIRTTEGPDGVLNVQVLCRECGTEYVLVDGPLAFCPKCNPEELKAAQGE